MKKAPEAFRTISEVAELLETPAHVLRFWESKFYQIRPVKRAGGRRYYRPDDLALIAGIRHLLQDKGMTIRGVQKVLQEQGIRHVAQLAPPLPALDADDHLPDEPGSGAPVTVPPTPGDAAADRPSSVVAPHHSAIGSVGPGTGTPPHDQPPPAAPVAAPRVGPPPVMDRPAAGVAVPPGPAEAPATGTPPPSTADPLPFDAADAVTPAAGDQPTPHPEAPETVPETAPQTASEITPTPVWPEVVERPAAERPAQALRRLPRDAMAGRGGELALLARRIDTLLDRMSEASGAGRW